MSTTILVCSDSMTLDKQQPEDLFTRGKMQINKAKHVDGDYVQIDFGDLPAMYLDYYVDGHVEHNLAFHSVEVHWR